MTNIGASIKFLAVALLLSVYFPVAHADIDCDAKPEDISGKVSKYLYIYSEECVEGESAEYKAFKVAPSEIEKRILLMDAWQRLSDEFSTLENETSSRSAMKNIFKLLSSRADQAKEEIQQDHSLRNLRDVSVARNASWKIPVNLFFLNYGNNFPFIDIEQKIDADCSDRTSDKCAESLKFARKLMVEWKAADRLSLAVSSDLLDKIHTQIASKDKLWEQYLYDSKPMLPLDFVMSDLLNGSWAESDEFYENGFPIPPPTQYFFLHPAVGMEWVSAADDGEEFKPTLYLEIFGANRWNPDNRWIDVKYLDTWSGFSVIVSYSDRSGTEDFGWGGLFTFSNVYSLGLTNHDGDAGIFLSLDLANLWRDKYKGEYLKYKNYF